MAQRASRRTTKFDAELALALFCCRQSFSGDFGGSYYLPRLVGNGKARELYFTGQILTAQEALDIGMVNRVVPHDQLEKETLALAAQLASGPTLAFARMKENLNRSEDCDLGTLLAQKGHPLIFRKSTKVDREHVVMLDLVAAGYEELARAQNLKHIVHQCVILWHCFQVIHHDQHAVLGK